MQSIDHNLIVGCSIPDNGGFEKKIDFNKFTKEREKLEKLINKELLRITNTYNIDVFLSNDGLKSNVKLHIDLSRLII